VKISFCTTCKNRLLHLEQTILSNIEATSSYDNREFILLNYNSEDSLDDWVLENLMEHIKSGLVKYYHTKGPRYFVASHAKNIAHRLATGDILVNIDADCFIEEGFCELLVELFERNFRILITSPGNDKNGIAGSFGKIAVLRDDFYGVGGYDENIYMGWGCEDENFRYRVCNGRHLCPHELEDKWNRVIDHSNEMRGENFQLADIRVSSNMSWEYTRKLEHTKEYVANTSGWGKASVYQNFHTSPILVDCNSLEPVPPPCISPNTMSPDQPPQSATQAHQSSTLD